MTDQQQVAEIIVESLVNAGVKVVFGIPGAKIDALFNTLVDHPEIKLIVCRHEQNAAVCPPSRASTVSEADQLPSSWQRPLVESREYLALQ